MGDGQRNKRVVLAVAGSGKTQLIIDQLCLDKRSLVITYTNNNFDNLKNRIAEKFGGVVPDNISLLTYFPFLYSFCFLPALGLKTRSSGIVFINKQPQLRKGVDSGSIHYYMQPPGNLMYSTRLAQLILIGRDVVVSGQQQVIARGDTLEYIKLRMERYYDQLLFDEVQDLDSYDFDLMISLTMANLDFLFVGDFYQHTYSTSRSGNKSSNLYSDYRAYKDKLHQCGLQVDEATLSFSFRCSRSACEHIKKKLGIDISSHNRNLGSVCFVEDKAQVDAIMKDSGIVKLFYEKHYDYSCRSNNWGASKGINQYRDVAVILNPTTANKLNSGGDLAKITRNKLYVALTRANNNVYIIDSGLIDKK